MIRILSLLVFLNLLFVDAVLAQVPSYVPTTNLVAWWGFTGNVNDASSAGNNLTNTGAVLTTDRLGAANSAYQFNGSSNYMQRASPTFSYGQTGSFSVSWWVQRSATGYGVALMHGSTTNGNFIWNFQTASTTSDMMFGANKQGSSWIWTQTSYAINQWEHFVAVYNAGAITLYKNGVSVGTNTFTHTGAAQATLPINIGRGVSGNYFAGKIDDIGIWTRALTPAEVGILFTGCTVSIANQPISQSAAVNSAVQFGVLVTDPGVTYQWQQQNGGTFVNLSNGGQFGGVATDTLLVSNLTMANNNNKFRCVVTKSGCADTSNAATLSVCGAIKAQPANQLVIVNSPVQFVTGSTDPAATFVWQMAITSTFGNIYNGALYSGVNTDTLQLNTTTLSNNNQRYRCIVTSGACVDTTDEAILTVQNNVGVDEDFAALGVKIYPNPAQHVLHVRVAGALQGNSFSIVNQLGQVLLAGEITGETTEINVDALDTGVYIIRVGDGFAQTFTRMP